MMFAAILKDQENVEAVGLDEDQIIRHLGEAHDCFYQPTPWTDDDIAELEASDLYEIDRSHTDHNSPVIFEIFEVPEGLRYGPDIRQHFEELREFPEPLKSITLYRLCRTQTDRRKSSAVFCVISARIQSPIYHTS